MAYCPDCAVELDDGRHHCPLCGAAVQAEQPQPETRFPPPAEADEAERTPIDWPRLRTLLAEVIGVLLFSPCVVIGAADVILNGALTWSRYWMLSLWGAWVYGILVLYFLRRPAVFYVGLFLNTMLLLAGLDSFTPGKTWFLPVGLPILGAVALLIGAVDGVCLVTRVSWSNLSAYVLSAVAVFCVTVDLLVRNFVGDAVVPTWSLIVVGSLVPAVVFLLYIHYRLSKDVDLGKIFHV